MVILLGLLLSRDASAFYNPQTGRWLSRDPIQERGGRNLTGFVENNPLSRSDYLGWGINDPPPGIPGVVKACKPCCCCADDISIQNIQRITGQAVWFPGSRLIPSADGHSFDAVAKMSFHHVALGGLSGGCTMRWVETANMVTTGVEQYMQPDVPIDMFLLPIGIRQKDLWYAATANPPCPGNLTATVNDTPAIQRGYGGPARTLKIVITLESTPNCPCASASKSVTFNQVLTFRNGQADWSNSSP